MTMVKKIAINTALILIPASVVAVFLPWENIPFSILIGGLMGLFNIKALAWSVEGLVGAQSVTMKMLFFSQFRFVMLTIAVITLAYFRLINILGVMAGFSVVFSQILVIGYRNAGTTEKNS